MYSENLNHYWSCKFIQHYEFSIMNLSLLYPLVESGYQQIAKSLRSSQIFTWCAVYAVLWPAYDARFGLLAAPIRPNYDLMRMRTTPQKQMPNG